MPRRRLSERQIERIERIQERRRQHLSERTQAALSETDAMDEIQPREGLVVVRHGANLAVEDAAGAVYHCLSRQNIGHPVCGDRVVWQPTGLTAGVVTAVQPRSTALIRPDYAGRSKPLAANLTQLVVVLAPKPEPSGYLLDQYLVAAENMGVATLILGNKMDLLDPAGRRAFQDAFAHYAAIGYRTAWLSLREDQDLAPATDHLAGHTSILVGQSGVGKSSLIQALLPDRDIQIGRLSQATGLGRHTTSATTCYRLPAGGHLIDSPGVRSFRLGDIPLADLERGFRDLTPYFGNCRFANCRHDQEPGCAVKAALDQGLVHPTRLASFQHLAAGSERHG